MADCSGEVFESSRHGKYIDTSEFLHISLELPPFRRNHNCTNVVINIDLLCLALIIGEKSNDGDDERRTSSNYTRSRSPRWGPSSYLDGQHMAIGPD